MAKRDADCLRGGVGGAAAAEEAEDVPGAGKVDVDGDTGVDEVRPYS